jgi:predicted metal-dependent hydrolase
MMNILRRTKTINTKEKSNFNDNFILGKDETLLPKFTRIFGTKYSVNVYYLRVQKPELNLTNSCINIHLPMSFRKQNNQDLLDVILLKMYTTIAEKEIENVMEKARHTFRFAPEDYEIKKMKSTLAHFDNNSQSILINPYIVMYAKSIPIGRTKE